VIAFDFKEALSFEGETGPYCQYAAVRANSIFRKLDEQDASTESGSDRVASRIIADAPNLIHDHKQAVASVLDGEAGGEIWSLLMLAARLEDANAQAAVSAEPAFLAKYTFNLARAFNLFYHRHRIIAEEDAIKRAVLIAVANYTRQQLTAALARLGIAVPERM
jgi:arginyl-tRNA synthetase